MLVQMKGGLYKEMLKDNKIYVDPPVGGKAVFYKVPSKSVEGKTYDLRVMPDGEVRCSCPFNVMSGKTCSHIESFVAGRENSKARESAPAQSVPSRSSLKKVIPF